eukprot:TRINITY_DN36385_c0_g1_i1.p1 TRINITY_DN36385_c0_g1~~TRINITY_DN36385_c0_g1_i1.p1  ORF type:complete len:848 (+),score=233.83 TRINITY_DN36385_c0_g1_i1:86-2545(+)
MTSPFDPAALGIPDGPEPRRSPPSRVTPQSGSPVSDGVQLHVCNLHPSATAADVRALFEPFGAVLDVEVEEDLADWKSAVVCFRDQCVAAAAHRFFSTQDQPPHVRFAGAAAAEPASSCVVEALRVCAAECTPAVLSAAAAALTVCAAHVFGVRDEEWLPSPVFPPEVLMPALGCFPNRVRTKSARALTTAVSQGRTLMSSVGDMFRGSSQLGAAAASLLTPLIAEAPRLGHWGDADRSPPPSVSTQEPLVVVSEVSSVRGETVLVDGLAGYQGAEERFRFRVSADVSWPDFSSLLHEHASPLLPQPPAGEDSCPYSVYWEDGGALIALRGRAHLQSFVDDAVLNRGVGRVVVRPLAHSVSPVRPPPMSPTPARAAGSPGLQPVTRWKRMRRIGAGTFGVVHEAMDLDAGRIIAVKQVDLPTRAEGYDNMTEEERRQVQQLRAEIELLRSVNHRNVVQYLGTEQSGGSIFIFMEYMAGGSLSQLARRFGGGKGGLEAGVVQQYVRQILEGLVHLHQLGIVHRDIKGDNILCDTNGVVKLADFGAAKRLQQVATISRANGHQPSGLKGTVLFLAPEVITDHLYSPASDVWAVGCTVIELATGQPPWREIRFHHELQALYKIATADRGPQLDEGLLTTSGHEFLAQCFLPAAERPRASQLLAHAFLSDDCVAAAELRGSPNPQACSDVSSFTCDYASGGSTAPPAVPPQRGPLTSVDSDVTVWTAPPTVATEQQDPAQRVTSGVVGNATTNSEVELTEFFGAGSSGHLQEQVDAADGAAAAATYSTFTSPPPTDAPPTDPSSGTDAAARASDSFMGRITSL